MFTRRGRPGRGTSSPVPRSRGRRPGSVEAGHAAGHRTRAQAAPSSGAASGTWRTPRRVGSVNGSRAAQAASGHGGPPGRRPSLDLVGPSWSGADRAAVTPHLPVDLVWGRQPREGSRARGRARVRGRQPREGRTSRSRQSRGGRGAADPTINPGPDARRPPASWAGAAAAHVRQAGVAPHRQERSKRRSWGAP